MTIAASITTHCKKAALIAAVIRPTRAEQVAEQARELDVLEERDIYQARMEGAENLPLRAGKWQHNNAGILLLLCPAMQNQQTACVSLSVAPGSLLLLALVACSEQEHACLCLKCSSIFCKVSLRMSFV